MAHNTAILGKVLLELIKKFFSDQAILKREEDTASLQAELTPLSDALKVKCEAYNKQQEEANGDEILIAKLDCNDPVAVAKIFPDEAKAIAEIQKKIDDINKPPDLSQLEKIIKLLIQSAKK
jgi:hypothetical protein